MDNVEQAPKRRKIQGDEQSLSTEDKDTPSNDTFKEVSENIPFEIVSFEDLSSEIEKNLEKYRGHPVHFCIFQNELTVCEKEKPTVSKTFKDIGLNISEYDSEYDNKTDFSSFLKSAYEDQYNSSILVPIGYSETDLKYYMNKVYKFNKDIIICMVNKYPPWGFPRRRFQSDLSQYTFKTSDISEKILNDLYLLEKKNHKDFIFSDSSIKFVIYIEYFIKSECKSTESNIEKYNYIKEHTELFEFLSENYYNFMNNKALFEKMNKQ